MVSNGHKTRVTFSFGQRLAIAIVPTMVSWLVKIISVTLRFEMLSEPPFKSPTGIHCLWHQCVLPCTWYFRKFRCCIIISRSFDGELIARTLAKFGYSATRGSSSRGGFQALIDMKSAMEAGMPAVFTADGPRGPIYKTKLGPIKLAQISGQPIGSFHLLPERAWQINSWDRFLIPKPFTRVIVSWGEPVVVPPDSSDAELEAKRQELEATMEKARHQAERYFGREPK